MKGRARVVVDGLVKYRTLCQCYYGGGGETSFERWAGIRRVFETD